MPANLRGWLLADLGADSHTIAVDLILEPGDYVVLGRNDNRTVNGNVPVDYVYRGFSLANSMDEILLLAPDGSEVDRVIWVSGSELSTTPGASLERSVTELNAWVTAQMPWPGSAGDFGSPGTAPTHETPGPTATPADPDIPSPSPTPTPASTAEPSTVWRPSPSKSPIQLDEVAFQGSDHEFVALRNVSSESVTLDGWSIGDAEVAGDGEGMYALPDDIELTSGERFVVARTASGFSAAFGRLPDAEIESSDPSITTLSKRSDLASGRFALKDSGDEIVLLDNQMRLADALAYKAGDLAALGLTGELAPASGFSLQRVPDSVFDPVVDQRDRYLYARPRPFESVSRPEPRPITPPHLADGLLAVWGTLGAQSNFSPDRTAPPGYLLAAAEAEGLHFAAIADPVPQTPQREFEHDSAIIHVPAWYWQSAAESAAIIYSSQTTLQTNLPDLLAHLRNTGAPAQWIAGEEELPAEFSVYASDSVAAPGNLAPAWEMWDRADRALLPGGNSNPPLPGEAVPQPRYTGLAVANVTPADISTALTIGRGWLTNRPGLWLTLSVVDEDGNVWWMGDSLSGSNEMTFRIEYGDLGGEPAGLAVWQNGKPLHARQSTAGDGAWTLTAPALPGSKIVAVATQADGDFALTAPLHIQSSADSTVLISEVMPSPSHDYNGDGHLDNDDEYIELFNLGTLPVSLTGWRISDRRTDELGRYHFVFGDDRYISGGQRLVLWHSETNINLDAEDDYVRLIDADGREIDQLHWTIAAEGSSFSRTEEDQEWQTNSVPSPGGPFGGLHGTGRHEEIVIDPTEGQVGGPPGSVAGAKRQGLERWVEFEATVVAPPGLFNSAIYVADAMPFTSEALGGIGIQVYLRNGQYPPLAEGDRVRVRGMTKSFRGEMEVVLEHREQIWRLGAGGTLAPVPVDVDDINESLEGRLVTFSGVVTGWQGDSIYLGDPDIDDFEQRKEEAVRVTVRSSLDWKRPYVKEGERFVVTGIVGQFAKEAPWNGGYRVLVRYPDDLVEMSAK